MKRLLLCGAVALSLVGFVLIAYRDNGSNEVSDRNYDDSYYNR